MGKYILALDEGTSSARAILFDKEQRLVGMTQKSFRQIYPFSGWVEQDPMEIYAAQFSAAVELLAMKDVSPADIECIGITNQRETTVVWDRRTGKPIYNAIVWQCRRSALLCEEIKKDSEATEKIFSKTGLIIDAYFSATKIKWILDNVSGAREAANAGELCFGTIDSWLLFKLTGGKVHATDKTNASRTMLYNIVQDEWDKELLDYFDIPRSMLPSVFASSHLFGYFRFDGVDIPITGIAGDQQASLFGQLCVSEGECKNTYGTGCFLLMNTGDVPRFCSGGLLTTVAATLDGQKTQYALEGSVFIGGAVISWLRDSIKLISDSEDSEYFASKVDDTDGVYIVPAFTGLGAPHWDMYARGMIVGLTRSSGKNELIRACLESIAYQTDDIIKLMEKESGISVEVLKADGGASENNILMQFQADISGIEVCGAKMKESTALGAAFLAGLSTGFWKDIDEIRMLSKGAYTKYLPLMDETERTRLIRGWKRALRAVKVWSEDEQV